MALSEFAIIEHYFNQTQQSDHVGVNVGIGDDAAIVTIPDGKRLAISVDTLIAGRHFPLETSPADIAYKALAVNLSDMAAMGAKPCWITLSISLPEADKEFLHPFTKELHRQCNHHKITLIGGDTVAGPLTITIQIMGLLPDRQGLLRSGAQVGDDLWVSGSLGDAAAGLAIIQARVPCKDSAIREELCRRLYRPTPRNALGEALLSHANSAIDISDGLLSDLGHILERSGVGAVIDANKIPLSDSLQQLCDQSKQLQQWSLYGGDDYELCISTPPSKEIEIFKLASTLDIKLTKFGTITSNKELVVKNSLIDQGNGFDHFLSP